MVKDDTKEHRYELVENDQVVAIAQYQLDNGKMTFVHTEVAPGHEGKGYGSILVKHALDDASRRGLHVVPACSFVASYIDRHPEYQKLLR